MKKILFILVLLSSTIFAQLTPIARTGDISDSLSAYTTNTLLPTLTDSLDALETSLESQISAGTMTALPSAKVYVGNGSGVATAVTLSGAITNTNTGVVTLADDVVTDAKVDDNANINVSKFGTGIIDNTEFNQLNGVESPIQTQLNTNATDIDAIETLASGKFYLGNGSNVATEVSMSGAATMTNAGVVTLNTSSVTSIVNNQTKSYSINISYPQSGEVFIVNQIDGAHTIETVTGLLLTDGGGDESVTFNIGHGTTPDSLFTNNETIDAYTASPIAITSYDSFTTFDDDTITDMAILFLDIGTVTGTVQQLFITVFYTMD